MLGFADLNSLHEVIKLHVYVCIHIYIHIYIYMPRNPRPLSKLPRSDKGASEQHGDLLPSTTEPKA